MKKLIKALVVAAIILGLGLIGYGGQMEEAGYTYKTPQISTDQTARVNANQVIDPEVEKFASELEVSPDTPHIFKALGREQLNEKPWIVTLEFLGVEPKSFTIPYGHDGVPVKITIKEGLGRKTYVGINPAMSLGVPWSDISILGGFEFKGQILDINERHIIRIPSIPGLGLYEKGQYKRDGLDGRLIVEERESGIPILNIHLYP